MSPIRKGGGGLMDAHIRPPAYAYPGGHGRYLPSTRLFDHNDKVIDCFNEWSCIDANGLVPTCNTT